MLFIVGGAFAGLDQIIQSRVGKRGIGFGAPLHTPRTDGDSYADVMPEDLLKFGSSPSSSAGSR